MGQFLKLMGRRVLANPHVAAAGVLAFGLLGAIGLPVAFLSLILLAFYAHRYPLEQSLWVLGAGFVPGVVIGLSGNSALWVHAIFITGGTWFLASLQQRYRSWSLLLESLAILSIVTILVLHQLFPEIAHWWEQRFTLYLQGTALADQLGHLEIKEVAAQLSQVATGIQMASMAAAMSVNILLAHCWHGVLGGKKERDGLRRRCHAVRISYTMIGLLAAGLVGGLALHWPPARDALPVLFLPFLVGGLSLVHWGVGQLPNKPRGMLFFFYVLLIFFMPYSLLMLLSLGLLDSLVNVRKSRFIGSAL